LKDGIIRYEIDCPNGANEYRNITNSFSYDNSGSVKSLFNLVGDLPDEIKIIPEYRNDLYIENILARVRLLDVSEEHDTVASCILETSPKNDKPYATSDAWPYERYGLHATLGAWHFNDEVRSRILDASSGSKTLDAVLLFEH
jgi:hypothetical protein